MTNTARLTAKVEWHGEFWVVFLNGNIYSVKTAETLAEVLKGRKPPSKHQEPAKFETTAAYVDRGGRINKSRKKQPPTVRPEQITLSMLESFDD